MARLREHRIMFSDGAWDFIREEAEAAGVSIGHFVRDAALVIAVMKRTERDPAFVEAIEDLLRRLR